MVIAAGSVMNDPSSGPTMRMASHQATGAFSAESRHPSQGLFRQLQNRTRGRDGHDDDHEHGLGEVDAMADVVTGRRTAHERVHQE